MRSLARSHVSSRPLYTQICPRSSRVQRVARPVEVATNSTTPVATAETPSAGQGAAVAAEAGGKEGGLLLVDARAAADVARDGGALAMPRTKTVCTIGPQTESYEALLSLAAHGMSVARLNMTHGTHAWHEAVIERIRRVNAEHGYCVAVMVDTEGSEVHTGALAAPIKTGVGTRVVFTVRDPPPAELLGAPVVGIGYGAFVEDVEVGDHLFVDGGMVELVVTSKQGPDVVAESIEQGLILSRANVTCRRNGELIRGRAAMLAPITAKDWCDIDWALSLGVDFLAISFVRTADALHNLRSYIAQRAPGASVELIAKLEAFDALSNIDAIIDASDGVMVARGDLGAQVPVEDVPSIQQYAVTRARQLGKPAIVAHQLLHSMIEYPIPTRAEVADVADVVRQKADALMLSGESAMGAYPEKALTVLRDVAARMEAWARADKFGGVSLPVLGRAPDERVSEELCASAAAVAANLGAAAIVAYTRRGNMAGLLSRCRPDIPVYALTDRESVRRRLALRWGVSPFLAPLGAGDLGEGSVQRTLLQLKERGFLKGGDLVVVVSDIRERDVNEGGGGGVTSDGGGGGGAGDGGGSGVQQSGGRTLNIRSVQVRQVP